MMPVLQVPVACVPWPIRIKLLPFDLSRRVQGITVVHFQLCLHRHLIKYRAKFTGF
ncbi:hypothetical protein [Salmonella enterica]|uniref:hypothetical protein n=1 Tax=Salmonella enterica TaxID=28901 RepID=UPI0034CFF004